ATHPRRDARRCDAVPPVGRDRGAVGARRRDRRVLAARPAVVPELRGGDVGPGCCGRARAQGRSVVASSLEPIQDDWTGEDVSITEVERELARLRFESSSEGSQPTLRTSVMTHIAWVPPQWQHAAEETLAGMAERHPSRTLLL